MNLFGRTDRDLPLLRLSASELATADQKSLHTQINHHCTRLAWKQHARTGAPVRDHLNAIAGAAYIRLNEANPDVEFDDDLLGLYLEEAQHFNEIEVCFGFLVQRECFLQAKAALSEDTSTRLNSILWSPRLACMMLVLHTMYPNRLRAGRAILERLNDYWHANRRRVAMDSTARETVRIVTQATGRDPALSECLALSSCLYLTRCWSEQIAEIHPRLVFEEKTLEQVVDMWAELGPPFVGET
ncbi:hypothetical protein [Lysobacter terrae]